MSLVLSGEEVKSRENCDGLSESLDLLSCGGKDELGIAFPLTHIVMTCTTKVWLTSLCAFLLIFTLDSTTIFSLSIAHFNCSIPVLR